MLSAWLLPFAVGPHATLTCVLHGRLLLTGAFAAILVSCAPCQTLPAGQRVEAATGAPRCLPSDPSCGPQRMQSYDACYRPRAARTTVLAGETTDATRTCQHDGDCQIAGCGNVCVHYRAADIVTDCMAYRELETGDVLCGCVSNMCSFFRQ